MPPGPGTNHVLFRDPVAVHTLGESVAEGVLLGRRRRWARRGLLSRCRERQPGSHPHNQKHANCSHRRCRRRWAGGAEQADHRHRLLLCTRSERPCDCHAAKYDEQFAPFHQSPPATKAWPTRNLSHRSRRLAFAASHCHIQVNAPARFYRRRTRQKSYRRSALRSTATAMSCHPG
jgi:hypothetical protein